MYIAQAVVHRFSHLWWYKKQHPSGRTIAKIKLTATLKIAYWKSACHFLIRKLKDSLDPSFPLRQDSTSTAQVSLSILEITVLLYYLKYIKII